MNLFNSHYNDETNNEINTSDIQYGILLKYVSDIRLFSKRARHLID